MKYPTLKNPVLATVSRLVLSALLTPLSAQAQLPPPRVSPPPVTHYEYDAEGNPTKAVVAPDAAGMAFTTASTYDTLNRRVTALDAKNGLVQFGHDGQDRLTLVIDPRSLSTQYAFNGLGDQTALVSPDTGTTTSSYDAMGHVTKSTDARGVVATYTYDPLNRPKSVTYTASTSSRTIQWTYDQSGGSFGYGIGRLTTVASPEVTTKYGYDAWGHVVTVIQAIAQGPTLTTSYTYDLAGHITRITYPSGRVVNTVHTGGLPSSITSAPTASGVAVPLLSNIDFNPFAGPRRWDWNMAAGLKAHDRVFDLSGRMVRYPLGPLVRDLVYDAADRITSFTHYDTTGNAQSAFNQGFTYDALSRLTSSTGTSATRTYAYDANGNRTTATIGTTVQTYATDKASNRVTSVSNPNRTLSYDNAGNIASDIAAGSGANYTGTYSLEGRLAQMSQGSSGVVFAYDALGQRVGRVSWAPRGSPPVPQPSIVGGTEAAPNPAWAPIPTGSARSAMNFYVYDLEGHLIGSYNSSGGAYAEYIWLEDTPVAVYEQVATSVGAVSTQLFYVHADHIDTPRVLQDTQGNTRWRWMAEPFGTTAPEEQPTASLPAVTFNLRMPGQQFEPFGGRFYNYFRDYDPSTGRYIQSDPIGLQGGLNTYLYVRARPSEFADRTGLIPNPGEAACLLGPNPVCLGGVVADVGTWLLPGVVLGGGAILATAKPPRVTDPEAYREWDEYKRNYAQPPPPGHDECEYLNWRLRREKALLAARQAWDAKWGAHHTDAIAQSIRAVHNAEKKLKAAGCTCPSS